MALATIQVTPFDVGVVWPQDDSYRGHVDPTWLRVLAGWVEGMASDPQLLLSRYFFVVAGART